MSGEKHGSLAVLKVANSGDVITVIDGGSSASLEEAIDTAETTSFGDTAKRYIAGLEDATLSFEGSWTPTNVALVRGIKRQVKAFEYYPAGEGSGNEKLTGDLIITSIGRESTTDDKVSLSVEFQVTGGVTAEDIA